MFRLPVVDAFELSRSPTASSQGGLLEERGTTSGCVIQDLVAPGSVIPNFITRRERCQPSTFSSPRCSCGLADPFIADFLAAIFGASRKKGNGGIGKPILIVMF
jgi:hypothetical protein